MRKLALLLMLAPPGPAGAQQRVVSPAADAVSVTAYRNPRRSVDERMELGWLGGYALITETRTINLAAGTSDIRFEGVADTLIPASVIIHGLPQQPDEKNYDARLLSPGALIDANLGRQVHVQRTNRATGQVTEAEAIIRSGPDGIILQTAAGVEALRCSSLPETIVYNEVPEDLSDKPTLSIRATSAYPTLAIVRLSYLATQFDWEANYVANLDPGGRTLNLFAWLTLANGNDASFPQAQASAVAGKPNKEDDTDSAAARTVSPSVHLRCWPAGNTSDVPPPPPPPAPPGGVAYRDGGEDIVVTGTVLRRESLMSASPVTVIAEQEELGDLKLYRIPEPVTVAANAQKQIALMVKERVPYERVYSLKPGAEYEIDEPQPVAIVLRMKNVKARGLGLPMPSGSVAVFEEVDARPMLVGDPKLEDTAVGQDVELEVGDSPDVTYTQTVIARIKDKDGDERPSRYRLELSNARATAAVVEVEIRLFGDARLVKANRKLGVKNGRNFWRAMVPASGRLALDYTITRPPPRPQAEDREEDSEE